MDPFGDNFGSGEPATAAAAAATNGGAQDAGANFLAQEQNELAALENQLLDTHIQTNDEDLMGGGEDLLNSNNQQEAAAAPELVLETENPINSDIFGGGGSNNVTDSSPVTNGAATALGDFDQNIIQNNNVDDDVLESSTPQVSIIAQPAAPAYDIKVEPESIRKWREEFKQRIADADEKEQTLKDEWLAKAEQEADEWRRQRNEMLEKTKKANREAEQIFIEERESRSKEGGDADWSKVSDLCDFNPKTSKGSKDTSRMRSLFLHLAKSKK